MGNGGSPTKFHAGDTVSTAELAVKRKIESGFAEEYVARIFAQIVLTGVRRHRENGTSSHLPRALGDARSPRHRRDEAYDIRSKPRRAGAHRLAQFHPVAKLQREHTNAPDRRHDGKRERAC